MSHVAQSRKKKGGKERKRIHGLRSIEVGEKRKRRGLCSTVYAKQVEEKRKYNFTRCSKRLYLGTSYYPLANPLPLSVCIKLGAVFHL